MESLVSAGSGALVCLSVWMALGVVGGDPTAAAGGDAPSLRAWCWALGSLGPVQKLGTLPVLQGAVDEVAELSWHGKHPLACSASSRVRSSSSALLGVWALRPSGPPDFSLET